MTGIDDANRLQQSAQRCLEAIHDRVTRSREPKTLLRAYDGTLYLSRELVRPLAGGSQASEQTLLRAVCDSSGLDDRREDHPRLSPEPQIQGCPSG